MSLRPYWKSVMAFLSLVLTNALADWTQRGEPWPDNGVDAARWLLSSAVGTWMVWQKENTDPKPGRHARVE